MKDSIGALLADVSRLIRRSFDEKARGIGVTRPQWEVIKVLKLQEGINQAGVADLLEVEPISLCRMIDRMQEAGLVERRRDPNDRRAWQLFLTDKSLDLIDQLKPLGESVEATVLEGISAVEVDQLRLLLNQMRQNISPRNNNPENDAISS